MGEHLFLLKTKYNSYSDKARFKSSNGMDLSRSQKIFNNPTTSSSRLKHKKNNAFTKCTSNHARNNNQSEASLSTMPTYTQTRIFSTTFHHRISSRRTTPNLKTICIILNLRIELFTPSKRKSYSCNFSHPQSINKPPDKQRDHIKKNNQTPNTENDPPTSTTVNSNLMTLSPNTRIKCFIPPIIMKDQTPPTTSPSPTTNPTNFEATKTEKNTQNSLAETSNTSKFVTKTRTEATTLGVWANLAPTTC